MNIGQRIKQKRIELGMTGEELAAKLGKNKSTIYRYENGDIENMPLDILEPIAKALHTTPAYLMGWDVDEINYMNEMQKDADEYSDSAEHDLKEMLIEISEMGFSRSEIQRIKDYALVIKKTENTSNELHEAFIDLFYKMYRLDLSIDDLNEIYTYAQFIKSKKH